MVPDDVARWPPGGSEMAGRIRVHDWSATPLGTAAGWTNRLRLAVEMLLASPLVTYVVCGPERVLLYNDATAAMLGSMHPDALGRSATTFFTEAQAVMGPLYDRAFSGEAAKVEAQPVDPYGSGLGNVFDLFLTPIHEEDGSIVAVQVLGLDVSARFAAEEERDRMLQGLRASEARLRLALDASRMGVWTYDPARSAFGVDARTAEITGVATAGWVPASTIWMATHPDDRTGLEARLAGMLDPHGDHWNEAVARFVHADGTERWTQIRAQSILEGGGPQRWAVHVLGTLLDITDGKRGEALLRESEQRFRAFVAASSDLMYRMNPDWTEMRQLDGRGILPDTPQPTEAWMDRYLTPDDQARVKAASEQAIRDRTMFELEHRVRQAGGTLGWIHSRAVPILDEEGRITEWLGTASDVTARKQAEAALRESEERFRAVANLGPDFLWSSDPDGRATWFSERWYAYTGQSEIEALGHGWQEVIHPDDREPAMARFRTVVEQGRVYGHEYRIRAIDGSYRWFLVRAGQVHDDVEQVSHCYGAVTDIDDLRRLQERQALMVDELQHRTRNLITVVRSIAHQTMASSATPGDFRTRFNDRLAALSRVQGLLSRSDREPITIRALVQAELDALGVTPEQVRVELEGHPVTLRKASVQTLALALHELATNARKYGALAGGQGRLRVAWETYRTIDGERWLSLTWLEEGISCLRADGPIRRGYGRELIEKALPYALKARTSYELGEAQLRCSIEMPMS